MSDYSSDEGAKLAKHMQGSSKDEDNEMAFEGSKGSKSNDQDEEMGGDEEGSNSKG